MRDYHQRSIISARREIIKEAEIHSPTNSLSLSFPACLHLPPSLSPRGCLRQNYRTLATLLEMHLHLLVHVRSLQTMSVQGKDFSES